MSHIATVQTTFKNLDDLAAACRRLGLEFLAGRREYGWCQGVPVQATEGQTLTEAELRFMRRGDCDHAIALPESVLLTMTTARPKMWLPHSIGVVRQEAGDYALVFESDWARMKNCPLLERAGKKCQELKRAYTQVAAVRVMRAQGFSVAEKKLPNGKVELVFRK